MEIILIILAIVFGIGLIRVLVNRRPTFKENIMQFFFVDVFVELVFSIMDFFDID
jgi:hypothetical protein